MDKTYIDITTYATEKEYHELHRWCTECGVVGRDIPYFTIYCDSAHFLTTFRFEDRDESILFKLSWADIIIKTKEVTLKEPYVRKSFV